MQAYLLLHVVAGSCMVPTKYHNRGLDNFFPHIKGKNLSCLICRGDHIPSNTASQDGVKKWCDEAPCQEASRLIGEQIYSVCKTKSNCLATLRYQEMASTLSWAMACTRISTWIDNWGINTILRSKATLTCYLDQLSTMLASDMVWPHLTSKPCAFWQ